MAQIPYRANLSAAIFPMTLARAGRSVIIPQADQNFNRSVDSPDDSNRDVGIPQIIYAENVLPTADGFQSVGYLAAGSLPASGVPGYFGNSIDVVVDATLVKKITLFFTVGGTGHYWTLNGSAWFPITIVGGMVNEFTGILSTANVRGTCYLHTGSNELYTVTFAAGTLTITDISATVLPVGILTGALNICGSFNYLVLLKDDGFVYYSSTITPTDWTPSLVSGAGSIAPNNKAGRLNLLRAHPSGFYIYAEGNVLNSTYTGNVRYPWRTMPVADTEGSYRISGDPTDSSNFVITNANYIQSITAGNATAVAVEVSEFLKGLNPLDTFNYTNNTFGTAPVGSINITYLLNRYIIISIGSLSTTNSGVHTQAIVYDLNFKRYGKFNIEHTVITDVAATSSVDRDIFFINGLTGACNRLSFDINDTAVNMHGVLVLGKFQYVRSRDICLDELSLESGQAPSLVSAVSRNFQVFTLPTRDGKTFLPYRTPTNISSLSTGNVMTYFDSTEGRNISLLIKGAFDLCSIEMRFHLGGKN